MAATHHLYVRLALAFRLAILLRYPAQARPSTTIGLRVSESSTTLIAVALGIFVDGHLAREGTVDVREVARSQNHPEDPPD